MFRSAYQREFPYLYRGIVEDIEDPQRLGRCKVRVPFIHGNSSKVVDTLPWARPLVLSPVKKGRGSVNLPDKGDVVWVFFEGAVKDCPVYIGGTYAIEELEIDPDKVDFYIEGKDKVTYDRKNRTYTIKVGDIEVEVNSSNIILKGDTIVEKNLSVKGNLNVSGTATVGNLVIRGSCNKECDCNC